MCLLHSVPEVIFNRKFGRVRREIPPVFAERMDRLDDPFGGFAPEQMVDDEVRSLCLFENVLQWLRFPHLRKLTDPKRIIEVFGAYEPDLVITDTEMPEPDGIQTVERSSHAN